MTDAAIQSPSPNHNWSRLGKVAGITAIFGLVAAIGQSLYEDHITAQSHAVTAPAGANIPPHAPCGAEVFCKIH